MPSSLSLEWWAEMAGKLLCKPDPLGAPIVKRWWFGSWIGQIGQRIANDP